MPYQYPCGGLCLDNISSAVNETSVAADRLSLANIQLKDHFSSENELSPKVRKPYTMTKQRERWKEEEHEKFLEALKLYGRDWRQIEEHVATKTAVQIRSHAQKFFSKVTRKSNGCSTTLVEHVDIPPPRPKRKPLHPYPRKEVRRLHKAASISEQMSSLSPQLSVSEKECQSPSSAVVAPSCSDALLSSNSSTLHNSASPESVLFVASGSVCMESNSSSSENKSRSPIPEIVNSIPHESFSKNLELFPKDDASEKDVSTEEVSIQSLKLFGRTVFVTDSHKQTPTVKTRASEPDLKQAENHKKTSICYSMVTDSSPENTECTLSHGAFYFIKLNNGDSNQGIGIPVSWWSSYGGFPFSFVHYFKQADSDLNVEVDDKETHKDQSCCGSNTGSVNGGENGDKCVDIDVQSYQDSYSKDELIGKPFFSELRTSHQKNTKGFVPYKRCVAKRDTGAEGEEKRIRLCL